MCLVYQVYLYGLFSIAQIGQPATVDIDGNWSVAVVAADVAAMGEGAETLRATASNDNGTSAPTTKNVSVDTQAPTTPTDAPDVTDNVANDGSGEVLDPVETIADGGVTNDNTPSVTVPADQVANGTPQLVIDGAVVPSTSVTNDDGSVILTPTTPLADGEHDLSYNLTDDAGNLSGNAPATTIIVDTIAPGGETDADQVAPVIVIAEAADGVNATEFADGVQTQVTLPTGTLAGDTITLTVTPDGGTAITVEYEVTAGDASNGSAEVTIPNDGATGITADGEYSVTATVTDDAGNVSTQSAAADFTVDTVAPTTPTDAPDVTDNVANDGSGEVLDPVETIADGGVTNDNTPSVTVPADQVANGTPQLVIDGAVVPSTSVTNDDGSVILTPTTPLADGEHDLSYNLTDDAGVVADMLKQSGIEIYYFQDTQALSADLASFIETDDHILIKASNGIGLNKLF
ncbi:Ig-like domain-containing protein [Psychrobacter sp.]|uniref:Ig-like domain-containing protein n=1 Tax=Psychrobacter sp. TaxID=56811 RepID=UPI003F990123